MVDAFRTVDITRVRGASSGEDVDRAATEEPLEVRLHGRAFAVIMRTPGADRELAAGFLLAERVLRSADDLGTIAYCTDTDQGRASSAPTMNATTKNATTQNATTQNATTMNATTQNATTQNATTQNATTQNATTMTAATMHATARAENIVNVTLADASPDALDRLLDDRRQVMGNSSCGLCGRLTIESLRADEPPIASAWTIDRATLASLPDRLREAQRVFDATGGLHAAGLFTRDGVLETSAEDVGRHNAVDKVIGRMLIAERLPLDGHVLFVSGRTSFEIVQKALFARIPIVASVSAPSSLAIDLARESGITLVGFVRGDGFNVYAHPDRVGR